MAYAEGSRRAQAQKFLLSGALKGVSGKETLALLREHGIGYRSQDFYADYREYKAATDKWDKLRYLPYHQRPSRAAYIENPGFQARRYKYNITSETYNPETGEVRTLNTFILSDTQLSRASAEAIALDALNTTRVKYQLEIRSMKVTQAYIRKNDIFE